MHNTITENIICHGVIFMDKINNLIHSIISQTLTTDLFFKIFN